MLIALSLVLTWVHAQSCSVWSEARVLGYLDESFLSEASDLSQSLLYPERFYQANDSARDFKVYLTTEQGQITASIDLGFALSDVEDMDVGPCPEGSCVFLGDIGDNLSKRTSLGLYIFPEQVSYDQNLQVKQIYLNYPDGAHDAESLAVHPDGTVYILTKASFNLLKTEPARLYKLTKSVWDLQDQDKVGLEFVLSLDLFALSRHSFDIFSHIATSMDFSNDAKSLLILTYGEAYELDFENLLAGKLMYQTIILNRTLQQEAITYTPEGGLLYTAESKSSSAPVKKVDCLSP